MCATIYIHLHCLVCCSRSRVSSPHLLAKVLQCWHATNLQVDQWPFNNFQFPATEQWRSAQVLLLNFSLSDGLDAGMQQLCSSGFEATCCIARPVQHMTVCEPCAQCTLSLYLKCDVCTQYIHHVRLCVTATVA